MMFEHLRAFLCHASEDKAAVRVLHDKLRQDGVDPWLDSERLLPGSDFDLEITNAVASSHVIIICLSHKASKEGYLQREFRLAISAAELRPEGSIFILPVRLEPCSVPARFSRLQYVNLFEPDGYIRLVRALTQKASELGVAEPARPSVLLPIRQAVAAGELSQVAQLCSSLAVDFLNEVELRELLTISLMAGSSDRKDPPPCLPVQERVVGRLLQSSRQDYYVRSMATRVLITAAFQYHKEEKWADVLRTVETLLEAPHSSVQLAPKEHLPQIKLLKLLSLTALEEFDDLCRELNRTDFEAEYPEELRIPVLCVALNAYERAEDCDAVAAVQARLKRCRPSTTEGFSKYCEQLMALARQLATARRYSRAALLVDDVASFSMKEKDPGSRLLHVKALYLGVYYRLELGKYADVVAQFRDMDQDFGSDPNEEIVGEVAWAGTEATRALRALNRHGEADSLAGYLKDRFGSIESTYVRKALAWSLVERTKGPVSAGDFESALGLCSECIGELESVPRDSSLDWPLAWTFAQRARCLEKIKRYAECVAACDELIERFGSSDADDIQFEVAWTMMEKVVALRRMKKFSASQAVGREILAKFADAVDARIVKERNWVVHAEGDTLLCEAKLFLQNGMTEEAAAKLRAACELFTEASTKDPECPDHLGCRAYSEFLLGDIQKAEQTFASALAVAAADWPDDDGWTELIMFPLPEDDRFRNWVQTRRANEAESASA